MKYLSLLILAVAYSCCAYQSNAQPKGIAFGSGSWKQSLAKAGQEGKLIFVDTYTTWCGPCKTLDRKVFTDSAVGNVFNHRFINLKVDAEKGEGIELARAYRVSAFPTMLFINADGQVVHEIIGLVSAEQLVSESEIAVTKKSGGSALAFRGSEKKKSVSDWNREFATHQQDTSFLYQYIMIRHENNVLDENALLDRYLELLTPEEQASDRNLALIATCLETFDSWAGQILTAHISAADKLEGKGYRMGRTFGFASATFDKAVARRDTQILQIYNHVIPILNKMYASYTMQDSEDSVSLILANKLRYLKETGDTLSYLRAIPAYVQGHLLTQTPERLQEKDDRTMEWFMTPFTTGKEDSTKVPGFENIKQGLYKDRTRETANQLNGYSSDLLAMNAGPGQLSQALSWSGYVQKLYWKPPYVVTESTLLKRLGRVSEARQALQRGIEEAKKRQADWQELQTALSTLE